MIVVVSKQVYEATVTSGQENYFRRVGYATNSVNYIGASVVSSVVQHLGVTGKPKIIVINMACIFLRIIIPVHKGNL